MNDKKQLFSSLDSTINSKNKTTDSLFTEEEIKILSEDDQKLIYTKETNKTNTEDSSSFPKVLIVDDEADVISITKLALNNFTYNGHNLQFFEAQSYDEAVKILDKEDDIALIFLDVVMKNNNDGLELVKYIRGELKNNLVHIILRTGQPGFAPEKEIIENYNINFYQTKADLTERKLHTLTTSSLRSYYALKKVSMHSRYLEQEVIMRTNELLQKNKELLKINETKNKMLSIIAHDLVNPFSSLIGYSEMLKENCQTLSKDKIQTFANILYDTSNNTYNLLNNLLQWLSSQTGNIAYKPDQIDLNRLIKQNVELLRNQASKKSIELIYNDTKSSYAYCDLNMISTVIRNLVSNAIKFTKKGNINIKTGKESNYTIITIEDTGIGMNSETTKNLFTAKNFSTEGTSGEKGTGLGLMLCKEFIDKNNGEISVESKRNKGSIFTIKLPNKK